jgi:hypothetical protein
MINKLDSLSNHFARYLKFPFTSYLRLLVRFPLTGIYWSIWTSYLDFHWSAADFTTLGLTDMSLFRNLLRSMTIA